VAAWQVRQSTAISVYFILLYFTCPPTPGWILGKVRKRGVKETGKKITVAHIGKINALAFEIPAIYRPR